ncbi:hypothetical protein MP228_001978 [Amoeboaphelidium protococcarum]|nr:hypothetical protein MP228_001978 [Amoeboaphelidium protococcarum]
MSEIPLISVYAQALYSDGQWRPFSAGYSQLILYGNKDAHTYRLIGRNVDDNQFIINSQFTATGVQYQQASDTFHQYSDGTNVYGFNFYQQDDARQFAEACNAALKDLATPQPAPPPAMPPPAMPPAMNKLPAASSTGSKFGAQAAAAQSNAAPTPAPSSGGGGPPPPPPPAPSMSVDVDDSAAAGNGLAAALSGVKLKKSSAPPPKEDSPSHGGGNAKAPAPSGGGGGGLMGEMAAKLGKRTQIADPAPAASTGSSGSLASKLGSAPPNTLAGALKAKNMNSSASNASMSESKQEEAAPEVKKFPLNKFGQPAAQPAAAPAEKEPEAPKSKFPGLKVGNKAAAAAAPAAEEEKEPEKPKFGPPGGNKFGGATKFGTPAPPPQAEPPKVEEQEEKPAFGNKFQSALNKNHPPKEEEVPPPAADFPKSKFGNGKFPSALPDSKFPPPSSANNSAKSLPPPASIPPPMAKAISPLQAEPSNADAADEDDWESSPPKKGAPGKFPFGNSKANNNTSDSYSGSAAKNADHDSSQDVHHSASPFGATKESLKSSRKELPSGNDGMSAEQFQQLKEEMVSVVKSEMQKIKAEIEDTLRSEIAQLLKTLTGN